MVGRIADFSIETSEVGNGQLTVDITYNGRSVPAQIEPEGSSRYHITFSPVGSGTYIIKVYFNGQEIQGSPYTMEVIDAKDVVTTGEGINSGEVGRRSSFFLNLGMGGSANDVKVLITSPRGNTVPANITDARNGSVTVEFVPRESGEHILDVTYFDKPVAGSPFACQVSDLNKISIMNLPSSGIVNRPVEFDIDASSAGQGNLEISVNDGDVKCAVQNQGGRLFHASFFPQDPIPHMIQMKFNGQDVPGSPWRVDVRNPPIQPHVSTTSNIQFVPVGMQAEFEFRGNNANGDFQVSVTTPSRRLLPVNIINMRNGSYRAEFTPEETGSHVVQVLFDGVMVPGSPFISKAYNVSAIIVSPPNIGIIGLPMEFTIDVTKAGEGKLEIMVNKGTVQNTVKMITKGIFGVNFIPHDARPHIVDILFNGEPVPQSPISIPIMDSRGRMVTGQGSSLRETAVNQQSSFQLHGQSVSEEDLTIKVTSPTGEIVPAKMVLQPDGDYKVEYSSRFTGRHIVEIMHAGVAIMGSPFYVEIYDPNKIRIEGNKTGLVGERMEFDIIRHQAGKADLKLIIKGPRGNPIKYEMYLTAKGDHVSYIPQEMGIYQLMITYGGLNVPGCPIKQEITDNSVVIASGEGLVRAIEDRVAVFYVDTKGQRGDLHVQVDGPKSIAKCNVESSLDGRYTVSYIPVEVGIFNVRIKWNSREIEGSPFRPRVGAATSQRRGVSVVGGWESLLDANNRMRLTLNETKRIEFDIRDVEPGQLSTSLRGPRGPLQVDMQRQDEGYRMLSFTPREEGEYRLKIFWNGKEIDRSPLLGICRRSFGDGSQIYQQQQQQHSSHYESTAGNQAGNNHATGYQSANIYSPGNPSGNGMYGNQAGHQTNQSVYQVTSQTGFRTGQGGMGANQPGVIYNLDKVVMTGIGLQQALVHQHAEFYIDGSNAGPGMPTVSMNGPGGDLLVQCLAVTPFKYKCTYFPTQPGIYLLHISWADRQVIGSPYKVNVQTTLPSLTTPTPTFQQAPELSLPVTPAPTLVVPNVASQLGATSQLGAASQLGATYSMTSTNLTTRQSTAASSALASKVFFTTDGLQGSLVGKDLKSKIDTRKAGPGELTAQCAGPTRPALCKLEDFRDGTFTLVVKPLEAGKHLLQVKYNGEQVQGSPFAIKVSGPPDPSKVRVFGPGIMPGVLSIYQSRFTVDTQGAGAGDLTVTIRGPKGGFRVEMQRKSQKDRDILCRYDPVEPGDYIIQVKWSGEHVPGSPFHVRIAGSEDELRVFQQQNQLDYGRYNDWNGDYN